MTSRLPRIRCRSPSWVARSVTLGARGIPPPLWCHLFPLFARDTERGSNLVHQSSRSWTYTQNNLLKRVSTMKDVPQSLNSSVCVWTHSLLIIQLQQEASMSWSLYVVATVSVLSTGDCIFFGLSLEQLNLLAFYNKTKVLHSLTWQSTIHHHWHWPLVHSALSSQSAHPLVLPCVLEPLSAQYRLYSHPRQHALPHCLG